MTGQMMDKWQDADWDLFAMGSLDAETQRAMQAHLRSGCRDCLASYETAVTTMTALASTAPAVEPSAGVEKALLARIAARDSKVVAMPSAADSTRSQSSVAALPPALPQRAWLGWAAAAVFALLALWMGVRLNRLTTPASVASTPQAGQPIEKAPQATTSSSATTTASSVPPVPEAAADDSKRKQELAELKRELAQSEAERDRALAQANESAKALIDVETQRAALQAQLASAQQQAVAHPGSESSEAEARLAQEQDRVRDLTRQLDKANAAIAGLHTAAARDGEILAFLRGGPTREIDLKHIDAGAGEATGVAYIAPGRGLLLVARGLPQLQAGKCYQLWSIHKSGTAVESVGLLQTDASGAGYLYARASTDLAQLTGLAITDEPSGGSVSARGRKLLFGSLN